MTVLAFGATAVAQEQAAPAEPAPAAADATPPAEVAPAVDPLVARGEYLARIGNCFSCHTRHEGEPFAGGLAFHTPYGFLGKLHSTNITPDPETGIGNWTEEQFVRAMHEGKAPNGAGLFPAFPYTAFTKITDEDAKAVYAYLRTVKPAKYSPPANGFVFSMRWGMTFWNALFFKQGRFTPDAKQSDEWNRGAYLVEGLGHCGACHTPRNLLLAEKKGQELSGGTYPDVVAPDKSRDWYAVNLTSAKSGLGAWSEKEIERYLKTGHSGKAGIFGPMNEVVVNSLQHLTAEDAKAMAVYLKSLPPNNEAPTQTQSAEARAAAETLYKDHCEECHMMSGRGGFMKAPPLAGSAVAQGVNPASLINVILYGAKIMPGGPTPMGAWEDMKSFGAKLSDEQIAAIATYVRSSWDNKGGVVTPGDVAKQR